MSTKNQTAEYKASEYFFDLCNIALENGFKSDEAWELSMATAEEKKAIEKQFHPTVATHVSPDQLNTAFNLVKERLNQTPEVLVKVVESRYEEPRVYEYIVAHIPARVRR